MRGSGTLSIKRLEGRVLLVEDNALLSDAFRVVLELAGLTVTSAYSMQDALAAGVKADVLLLDLSLPDGDGLALLPRLSERGLSPHRTLALTGRDDGETTARCKAAGCHSVLLKPVGNTDLLRHVEGALSAGTASAGGH